MDGLGFASFGSALWPWFSLQSWDAWAWRKTLATDALGRLASAARAATSKGKGSLGASDDMVVKDGGMTGGQSKTQSRIGKETDTERGGVELEEIEFGAEAESIGSGADGFSERAIRNPFA